MEIPNMLYDYETQPSNFITVQSTAFSDASLLLNAFGDDTKYKSKKINLEKLLNSRTITNKVERFMYSYQISPGLCREVCNTVDLDLLGATRLPVGGSKPPLFYLDFSKRLDFLMYLVTGEKVFISEDISTKIMEGKLDKVELKCLFNYTLYYDNFYTELLSNSEFYMPVFLKTLFKNIDSAMFSIKKSLNASPNSYVISSGLTGFVFRYLNPETRGTPSITTNMGEIDILEFSRSKNCENSYLNFVKKGGILL